MKKEIKEQTILHHVFRFHSSKHIAEIVGIKLVTAHPVVRWKCKHSQLYTHS